MKTGAWLRGGRGKIAGMVAQKSSDGKGTVLRELVIPKNPQSVDQMATRLAFGTVTQAAGLMLPIIGQSFEGQASENKNRQRFVQLNNPILRAIAKQQANQGLTAMAGSFRGKSSNSLQPNPYRISEGSLAQPESIRVYLDTNGELTSESLGTFNESLIVGQKYSPLKIFSTILGLSPKNQVTIVAISTANGAPVYYDSKSNVNDDYIRGYGFTALRLVFKDNAEDFIAPTEQQGSDTIKAALMAAVDRDKTSDTILYWLEDNLLFQWVDGNRLIISVDSCFADIMPDYLENISGDYTLVAEGIFISRLVEGQWRYSSCTMACKDRSGDTGDENNNNWYGFVFDSALIDYIGLQAASTLYTRKGGDVNVI